MSRFESRDDQDPIDHARRARTENRQAKTISTLGILSIIGGVLSIAVGLIPCVGSLAMISGFVGLILGGVGLLVAGQYQHGKGFPIAGIVLNALSLVVSAAMVYFVWSSVTAPNPDEEEVKRGTAITIGAERLATEFGTNPAKADATYNGKIVEVIGRVVSVDWEYPHFVVKFASGGTVLSFRCERGNNTLNPPTDFSIGEAVTVRGRCTGVGQTLKNTVFFSRGIVSRGSPAEAAVELPPAVVTAATKLLADYGVSRTEADSVYRGRYLEITATIHRISQNPTGRYELLLNAATPAIGCTFPHTDAGRVQKLKVGDTVTLRGTCVGSGKHAVELQYCTLVE